ncbi:LacI family transcription regulator [Afipia sp. P52-10]|uniref:LacI family DNA-binding transcriptional regulator n=1 Tax=Afipia sp. P52-10 TaxID=1429916 RepID=UPI0003DF0099|nr:LacI family DNA-binding transcriptional regulator [Afipia sp. P52-10]ETR76123.1 LacI family transcription regulator [Afipia sp. P52-10]
MAAGRRTIKDVARLAGVSLGSASRALSGADNVSEDTIARVKRAAASLRYQPNHAARSLRSRSTKTIGCMFADMTNPLYAKLFDMLETRLERQGYMTLISNTSNQLDREIRSLKLLAERGLDALIVAPAHERNRELNDLLAQLPMPYLVLDREVLVKADTILFDHAGGLTQVVEHLAGLGHKRIGLVTANLKSRPGRRRISAFKSAMRAQGLKILEENLVLPPTSMSSVYDSVIEMLSRKDRPTAIVVQGTGILSSTLNAIATLGLRIPRDLSLVSIGRADFIQNHVPAISTLRVDYERLSDEIAAHLFERLGNGNGHTRKQQRLRRLFPYVFEARASTAPPRKAPDSA